MKAAAPGKLVLSGAYAVLRGAPAIVTAVDRYVVADATLPPAYVSQEVVAAGIAPVFYEPSQLFEGERKLGLGSSSAILLSSLLAREGAPTDESGRDSLFRRALRAHRLAQGGGSGIDVAAATYGGTLEFKLRGEEPLLTHRNLPKDLRVDVWSSPQAAKTSHFLKRVFAAEKASPQPFRTIFDSHMCASNAAADAVRDNDAEAFVQAAKRQGQLLYDLGCLASVPIVPQELKELAASLNNEAALLPSGAGGGDVSLYVSTSAPPASFEQSAQTLGLVRLSLRLGADGAHIVC